MCNKKGIPSLINADRFTIDSGWVSISNIYGIIVTSDINKYEVLQCHI